MSDKENEWSDGVNVGMQLGIKFERERIIELLEANLRPIAASGDDPESYGWREGMGYALALINGENE